MYLIENPSTGPELNFRDLNKQRNRSRFQTDKKWPPGIWVDKESRCEERPLMEYLISRTKMSCALCDPEGLEEEFLSFKHLRDHFRKSHNGSTVCNVCYQVTQDLRSFENVLSRPIVSFRGIWKSSKTQRTSKITWKAIHVANSVLIVTLGKMNCLNT